MKKKGGFHFSRGAMRQPRETVICGRSEVISLPSKNLAAFYLVLESPGFSVDPVPVAPPELSPGTNAYQPYNPANIMKGSHPHQREERTTERGEQTKVTVTRATVATRTRRTLPQGIPVSASCAHRVLDNQKIKVAGYQQRAAQKKKDTILETLAQGAVPKLTRWWTKPEGRVLFFARCSRLGSSRVFYLVNHDICLGPIPFVIF